MAKIYRGKNPNRTKYRIFLTLSILFIVPILVLSYAQIMHGIKVFDNQGFILVVVLGWPSVLLFSQANRLGSGIAGESNAVKYLSSLPDEYCMFTNVPLNNNGRRCEVDVVVVGPRGVIAIEVKGHNGIIEGHSDQDEWVQHKTGRKGGSYSKQMRNPIRQVNRNIYLLSQHLKQHGLNVWIDGIVAFTSASELNVSQGDVPVVYGQDLPGFIYGRNPRHLLSENEVQRISAAITVTMQ